MSSTKMDPNPQNPLGLSWHDSAWLSVLDGNNVLEYFSDRSNPFYDRTCNNETVKMQRLDAEVMNEMTGLEYILLHVQEPILFIIRYHPSKGYWWDFGKDDDDAKKKDKEKEDQKETASLFQRRRVDLLLGELARRYPPKLAPPSLPVMHQSQAPTNTVTAQAPAPPTASGTQQANTASAASTTQSNAATAANNNTAPTTNHKTPAAALKQGEGHPEKRPRIA